ILAQSHLNGTYAYLYPLEDDLIWLIAVHEGAVITRSDRLFTSVEPAKETLDELKKAYPQIRVLAKDSTLDSQTHLKKVAPKSLINCRLISINRLSTRLGRVGPA